MTRPLASLLILALVLLTQACAGRRIRRENALALAAADARVLDGCYDCLLDAWRTYEQLATSKYANSDTIALRRLETALLLVLREKELVLDWRPAFVRATALADSARDPAFARRLVAIVDAVLPDATGRRPEWPEEMRRERARMRLRVPGEIEWLATAPVRPAVRDYLALALDCSYGARVLAPQSQPGARQRRPVLPPDAPPLITYGTGICLTPDTNMMAAALALVPRFHEAAYFAGSVASFTAESDGGERALTLLNQAYARFPDVPGVTFMRGWLRMELGECALAVAEFEATIVTDSTHDVARLNGTICLSRLERDSAAAAWATRLIAMNTRSAQPAYYWRAVSRYRLKDLPGARSDIDSAKALRRDANALTLAGIIENDQGELPMAEHDLREALALPLGERNCTAAWTLGLVLAKQQRAADAATTFESAMGCYDRKMAVAQFLMRRLRENPPANAAYATRRLAALAADSADAGSRYYASAFNAAGHAANSARVPRAMELLDIAAADPRLAEPVAKMREAIAAAVRR